jgi:ABC-type glycerol-3-phosphate transport system substrate-binding protein
MSKKILVLAAAILFASAGVFASGGQESASTPRKVEKVYFYAWTHPDNMIPLTEAFNKDYAGKYEPAP